MQSISDFISEGLTQKQTSIVGELILSMFKSDLNLTIDQIKTMFMNVDLSIIGNIEEYIFDKNKKDFLPYYADGDILLKAKSDDETKNKIITQLATYLKNLA